MKFAEVYSTIPIHVNAGDYSEFFSTGAFAAYTEMANRPDEYFFSQCMLKYEKNSAFGATADPTVQAYLLGDYTEEECLEILDDFWAEVIE